MSSLLLINVVRFVCVLFVDVSKRARVEMFMLEAVSETSSRITLSLYSNTMSDTLWFWTRTAVGAELELGHFSLVCIRKDMARALKYSGVTT
jgi:hypothetical protein